jgi:hypothetical protein
LVLSIGFGHLPAFIPADNTQQAAPISGLEQAFLEVYALKQYYPTIMNISNIEDINAGKSVYYSLSMPTLLDGATIDSNTSTLIQDLRGIKTLIDTIKLKKYSLDSDSNILDRMNFEYYHTEQDFSGEIKSSDLIVSEDDGFLTRASKREFCKTSPFFRGCVKITTSAT